MQLRKVKSINITIFFAILSIAIFTIYAIAQNNDGSFIALCDKHIDDKKSTPLEKLDLASIDDNLTGCASNDDKHTLILSSNKHYYDNFQGKKEKTWLSETIFSDLKVGRKINPWLGFLAIANPKMDYITHNDDKNFILLGGEFSNIYSIWYIQVEKNEKTKSKSLKQWNLINLADRDFNIRFGKLLADPNNFDKSNIQRIINWGTNQDFSELTIRALLRSDCFDSSQNSQSKKNLNIISLNSAFEEKNGRPTCIEDIVTSGISENNPISYLIETNKGWYAWQGNKAKDNNNYEPYPMEVAGDEEADLRKHSDEAWFRLKNYAAILLENISGYKTYVNKATNDIYCIKSESNIRALYQPINISGDSSGSAVKIKESLKNLTRGNYYDDKLIRNVIQYWINQKKDHYIVYLNTNNYGINIDASILSKFSLVTIYKEDRNYNTDMLCVYGWNEISIGPELLSCNFCKYLSYSDKVKSGVFSGTSKILGVQQITKNIWNVCMIVKQTLDYNLSVFEIDTSNKNNTTKLISNPLENVFGLDINKQETENKYLEVIWDRLKEKNAWEYPPANSCDAWINKTDIDDFLKTEIIIPLLNNQPAPVIRQLLPQCNEFSADESPEKLLLHHENVKADTSVIPTCFTKNKSLDEWKYLVEENGSFKRYFSNNSSEDTWYNEPGIKELNSAWLTWLTLANNNVKVISTLQDCNNNSTNYVRVCLILNDNASLFSWISNSSNSPYIPAERKIVASDKRLFLRPSTYNTEYLNELRKGVTKQERQFYCSKADTVDFEIADHFGSFENRRCVLYHLNNDKEEKLTCISNVETINERKIFFKNVLQQNSTWVIVKSIYSANAYRGIFGKEVALYEPNVLINTYWGSADKFGIQRGNEVGVFTKNDNTSKQYRFGFLNSNLILNTVGKEFPYVTFDKSNPGNIEDYFYSWINDNYKKGNSNNSFWRANPLGYFDRLNPASITK